MAVEGIEYRTPDEASLSSRERQIVTLASRGATDKEIADELEISVASLRTYWNRVRDKLGAVNRTHAIALSSFEGPAMAADTRSRLTDSLVRGRLGSWIWRARNRQVLLDEQTACLFGLAATSDALPVARLLGHVWSPDRARFDRFLSQAVDLRPMTPIELRVGPPGDYRNLVRTINLACQSSPDVTVLLATTTIHVFS